MEQRYIHIKTSISFRCLSPWNVWPACSRTESNSNWKWPFTIKGDFKRTTDSSPQLHSVHAPEIATLQFRCILQERNWDVHGWFLMQNSLTTCKYGNWKNIWDAQTDRKQWSSQFKRRDIMNLRTNHTRKDFMKCSHLSLCQGDWALQRKSYLSFRITETTKTN